jgi:nucleotide-binding universal stress UspA family protein
MFLTSVVEVGSGMIEHVVVGSDGSECGTNALRRGVGVAERFDAAVTLVVVAGGELSTSAAEEVAAEGREIGAASRVRVRTRVEGGKPPAVLDAAAEDVDADVIVLGTQGHTGLAERLLGSTTERVIGRTDRPVLAVPPTAGAIEPESRVLVTSDGSEAATAAVQPASEFAVAYDAAIRVLRVVDVALEAGPFNAGGVDEAYVTRLTDEAATELDAFAARCEEAVRDATVEIEQVVRTGTPSEEIAAEAADADVSLVAMASTGHGKLSGRLLGSTTDRVLRTVDVPVLVVPGGA